MTNPAQSSPLTADDHNELGDDALESVAGGGIIDVVVAAAEYVHQKINQAGQQIMNAANGGGPAQ